jgi:hypothetical protein
MRPPRAVEICIDVVDPRRVAGFWCELLGYVPEGDLDARWVHLEPPEDAEIPVLNLQRVPEHKEIKNRLHLDVYVDDTEEWIAQAVELGASRLRLNDDANDWYQVMADVEGNEFCICREDED